MNKVLTINTQSYEDYNYDGDKPYWKPKWGDSYAIAIMDDEYDYMANLIVSMYLRKHLPTSQAFSSYELIDLATAMTRLTMPSNTALQYEQLDAIGGRLYMWQHNSKYLPVITEPRHVDYSIWESSHPTKRILLEDKAA